MSRDVTSTFADIDSFDPDRFVTNLTPDAVFRFGNADPVIGRAAVRDAVAGFFTTIDGLTHRILETGRTATPSSPGSRWSTGARTARP